MDSYEWKMGEKIMAGQLISGGKKTQVGQLISGGKKTEQSGSGQLLSQPQPQGESEDWLSTIGRNIGATGLKAVGNIESLLQLLSAPEQLIGRGAEKLYQTVSGKQSPSNPVSELGNKLGFNQSSPQILQSTGIIPTNYLDAKNATEHFLQTAGSQLPFSSGSPLISLLGAGANTLAREAGLGENGQALAQLGTELPLGLARAGIRPGALQKEKKSLYESLPNVISKNAIKPKSIDPLIKKTHADLMNIGKYVVDRDVHKEINNALNTIRENFPVSKGNPIDAFNARKALYEYRKTASKPAHHYIDEMTAGLNSFIKEFSNPQFYNALTTADKYHAWQKTRSTILDYLDQGKLLKILRSTPAVRNVVQLADLLGDSMSKYFFRTFSNKPVRDYALRAAAAASLDKPKDFIKYSSAFQKSLSKELAKEPNSSKISERGQLINGA